MVGEPTSLNAFDLAVLDPESTAIFLDFDGTVADLAERPDEVSVPAATRKTLERLASSTGGAVAIITGRPIDEIDRFLAPLRLPVAGVHGLERRDASGYRSSVFNSEKLLKPVNRTLRTFANAHPGLLLETKPGATALHYRQRPELERAVIDSVHEAVTGLKGVQILHGKMVVEVKSGKATKADAVEAFMAEPPFRGKLPLFAGDDVTDEDAFREITRKHGISIKVGRGDTAAAFRTQGAREFRNWLAQLADIFETRSELIKGI